MTTVRDVEASCSLCGKKSNFRQIGSTNAFGSPDLDSRPPQMERSTIFAWVQRCPGCGYCASDVGTLVNGAGAVVATDEYRRQLCDTGFPELANSFQCKSFIDRGAGDYAGAAWALIHAAWASDDSGRPDAAAACRVKAADMLVLAEKHGQEVMKPEGAIAALLADLLRRAGRPEAAGREIAARRAGISAEVIARVLDYQASLLAKGDVACHTIAEALGKKG